MASDPLPPGSPDGTVPAEFPLPQPVKDLLKTLLKGAKKRKGQFDKSNADVEPGDYIDYGRSFAWLGEPFNSIFSIVEHGLWHENQDSDDEADTSSEDLKDKQLLGSWHILCHTIPMFRDEIFVIAQQRHLRSGVCAQINYGVEHARSDDTGGLKEKILGYVHEDVKVPLSPHISPSDPNKSIRGWKHPSLAALLTPIDLETNDPDSIVLCSTTADMISGRVKVTAHQLPRFLYPHNYSEDDLDSGLFRGHLMLRVAKHIYRGPSAALQGPGYRRGGRRPICQIIKMRKMTLRSLAYVAVQARFAISDVQEWHIIDQDFNYETFFWNLVDLLGGEEGKTILSFYDEQVIGLSSEDFEQSSSLQGPSSIERVKAQRTEKRAHLEASLVTRT